MFQVLLPLDSDLIALSHSIPPTQHASESNYDGKELEVLQNFSPSSPIISDHHPLLGSHCHIHLMRAFLPHPTSVYIWIHISYTALHTCYAACRHNEALCHLPFWEMSRKNSSFLHTLRLHFLTLHISYLEAKFPNPGIL